MQAKDQTQMVVWNCRENAISFQKHNFCEKCQSRADDEWDTDIKDKNKPVK